MLTYEFQRGRERAVTVDQFGRNLPGGLLWEPASLVDSNDLRGDIAAVLRDVGFFIWS